MHVDVLLFGPEAASVGASHLGVDLPAGESTCGQIRSAMSRLEPRLAPSLTIARFAVNHQFVDDTHVIAPDDEIALIGPVSGG
jgi:molybdopterin converting factor small subunit